MATWKCMICNWDNSEKWDKCAKCGAPRVSSGEAQIIRERREDMRELNAEIEAFYVSVAPKWAYLQVSSDQIADYGGLGKLGSDGWELVAVTSYSEGGGMVVNGVGGSSYAIKFLYAFKRAHPQLPDHLLSKYQHIIEGIRPQLVDWLRSL